MTTREEEIANLIEGLPDEYMVAFEGALLNLRTQWDKEIKEKIKLLQTHTSKLEFLALAVYEHYMTTGEGCTCDICSSWKRYYQSQDDDGVRCFVYRAWLCLQCGYEIAGSICTKCGTPTQRK